MRVTVNTSLNVETLTEAALMCGLAGEARDEFCAGEIDLEIMFEVDADGVSKIKTLNGQPILDVRLT